MSRGHVGTMTGSNSGTIVVNPLLRIPCVRALGRGVDRPKCSRKSDQNDDWTGRIPVVKCKNHSNHKRRWEWRWYQCNGIDRRTLECCPNSGDPSHNLLCRSRTIDTFLAEVVEKKFNYKIWRIRPGTGTWLWHKANILTGMRFRPHVIILPFT